MRKIYVVCPAYMSTGGTELLHQLVFKLNNVFNIDACIFYPNVDWKFEFDPTPTKFLKYIDNTWVESLEDAAENIIIVPETMTKFTENYKLSELWIWWLSIDNFFVTIGKSYTYKKYLNAGIDWRFRKLFNLKPYKNLNTTLFNNNVKLQLYQSEYANAFLKKLGAKITMPLSDYIGGDYINKSVGENHERINQVLYNPVKGFEITSQLIKSFPEIKWMPIVKLKADEVSKLLSRSKVYVDFGNHPGKDRIPREAVLNGCCIIVNKEGAAANNVDIDILDEFKIENPIQDQLKIIALIKKCFDFYDDQYLKFASYAKKIRAEEHQFEIEIEALKKYM